LKTRRAVQITLRWFDCSKAREPTAADLGELGCRPSCAPDTLPGVAEAQLSPPTWRLQPSWLASRDEWGRGVHQDGASLGLAERLGLDLDDPADFRDWVEALLRAGDPSEDLPDNLVPASNLWIVQREEYLGAIQLRHRLNPFLAEIGGHVGFGVRPSFRRRGLASFALSAVLPRARRLGLPRVLLTCDDTNTGSARTIEATGGVLERIRQPDDFARSRGFHQPVRQYWITL
jgi:predicted acetyltransferase